MFRERCYVCNNVFRDGDNVVPILKYITNERRGDFVTTQGHAFIHAHHLKEVT